MISRISSLALLLFVLAASLALSPKSQAGASNKNGNPFGNGTFFNTTGTFSAVIRGQNLSGTMLFSSGYSSNTASSSSSSGSCVISYLGSSDGGVAPGVYFGNSTGMWDPSSGSISGQFWGGYTLSGVSNTIVKPEMYNPSFPYPVTTTNGDGTTNITYVAPRGANTFNNSAFMNGNFDGTVQNKYPNQTFTAQGMIMQQQLYPQQVDTTEGTVPVQMAAPLPIPVSVQGIRVSDSYSSFATISNSIPYSFTTYTITNAP